MAGPSPSGTIGRVKTSPGSRPQGFLVAGRYRIERKLGSGSMGTVYLARDERTGSRVALKLMKAERLDPEGLATLQREFSSIASPHHPQIARAHDFGYTEGNRVPFYTREYIEGVPVAPGPPGSAAQAPARDWLKPLFDLLDALH